MNETEKLLSLIPHRGKMIMLSRILECDTLAGRAVTEFDISPDCLFYDAPSGGMPAWAAFECAAQTVAVLSGALHREKNEEPRMGAILSVSNLIIHAPLLTGTISVHVDEEMCIEKLYTFNTKVYACGEPAFAAKLTVLDVDNFEELKKGGLNGGGGGMTGGLYG